MGVAEYVRALLASDKLGPQVRHHRCEPARAAVYAESRLPWPAAIRRTLEERGLSGLYSHQALATDHIHAGHSVVVATPTASGKSLIYNLPVLERHLRDSEARALYLFPLKALAQDQLAGLQRLVSGWPEEAPPPRRPLRRRHQRPFPAQDPPRPAHGAHQQSRDAAPGPAAAP